MPDSPNLYLEIGLKREFDAGDDQALLKAIEGCCRDGVALPEWAASAFVECYRRGDHGEIRSWDEVFGRPTPFGTMERIKRKTEQSHAVLEEVERAKSEGKTLDNEGFTTIGRKLGVGSKTKVIELLGHAWFWREEWRPFAGWENFWANQKNPTPETLHSSGRRQHRRSPQNFRCYFPNPSK